MPFGNDEDAAGELRRKGRNVRAQNCGFIRFRATIDFVTKSFDVIEVETREWFVEYQTIGIMQRC